MSEANILRTGIDKVGRLLHLSSGRSTDPSQSENSLKNESESTRFIKDSWFKAYLEANSLWPQENFAIRILTASAIVDDPPTDWNELPKTILSPEQLEFIGKIASNAHHEKGITRATEPYATEADVIIPQERFQSLLKGNIDYTTALVLRYIDVDKTENKDYTDINRFFTEGVNKERVAELRRLLHIGRDVILSPAGKELAQLHRKNAVAGWNNQSTYVNEGDLTYVKSLELIKRYYPDHFAPKLLEINSANWMAGIVQVAIKEVYPEVAYVLGNFSR